MRGRDAERGEEGNCRLKSQVENVGRDGMGREEDGGGRSGVEIAD